MLATNLLRVSVVATVVATVLGIGMGISQDFRLMSAHSHLNLLGFVALFLAGLYYNAVPQAAKTLLAKTQAWIAVVGAIIFPAGVAMVLLGGHHYEPAAIIGSLIVLAGMLLFAWVVFRHGFGAASERA
jgi:hypothetical protein